MTLAKRPSTALSMANDAMLKRVEPEQFKELLAGYLLKCIKLNMEPLPDPEGLGMVVSELYDLLQITWPGVKPSQIWATLKAGMARQGQYRIRVNYPTVANWFMHHRVLTPQGEAEKAIEKSSPPIQTQVEGVLNGMKEYRERVASGEYKPRGRG